MVTDVSLSEFIESAAYQDKSEAEEALFAACQGEGFTARLYRPENKDTLGRYHSYTYICSHGGKKPQELPARQRVRTSSWTGCEWMARLSLGHDGFWRPAFVTKGGNRWRPGIPKDHHNHPLQAGENAARISINRVRAARKPSEENRSMAADSTRTAATIADDLQRSQPEIIVHDRGVENLLAPVRQEQFGGSIATNSTATQQLLHVLEGLQAQDEVWYAVIRNNDDRNNSIERIFWTYPWCIDMWKRNPELLSIDNTYKVNRFNMHLCLISGVTPLHTTFPIIWCLLTDKEEESFIWALTQLQACARDYGGVSQAERDLDPNQAAWVYEPYVILSDLDKAFKRAARATLPNTVKHQICVWHILKDVAHIIKQKWVGSLNGTVLVDRGSGAGSTNPSDSESEDLEYSKDYGDPGTQRSTVAVQTLIEHPYESITDLQAGVLAHRMLGECERANSKCGSKRPYPGRAGADSGRVYLNNANGILLAWRECVYSKTECEFTQTWDRLKAEFSGQTAIITYLQNTYLEWKEQFAEWAIRNHRNYGLKATSKSKGSHAVLNLQLHTAIQIAWNNVKIKYDDKLHDEKTKRLVTTMNDPFFNNIYFKVSHWILNKIFRDSYRKAKEEFDRNANQLLDHLCSGSFSNQFGAPCWHTIYQLLKNGEQLQLSHIDTHWWLQQDDPLNPEDRRQRLEQDPKVVPRRYINNNHGMEILVAGNVASDQRQLEHEAGRDSENLGINQFGSDYDSSRAPLIDTDQSHDSSTSERRHDISPPRKRARVGRIGGPTKQLVATQRSNGGSVASSTPSSLGSVSEDDLLIQSLLDTEKIRANRDEAIIRRQILEHQEQMRRQDLKFQEEMRRQKWEYQEQLAALQRAQQDLQLQLQALQQQALQQRGFLQPQNHQNFNQAVPSPAATQVSQLPLWQHQSAFAIEASETTSLSGLGQRQQVQSAAGPSSLPTNWPPEQRSHSTTPLQPPTNNQQFGHNWP